jgi:antitoxin (DNA-binding transcriptional repressor) of toxin-antitoxin stability system
MAKENAMLGRTPTTERMTIAEVESRFSSLVGKISREDARILVEEDGNPVAGIVPIEDMRRLARLDERDREAYEILEAMRAPFNDVSPEEMERQVERILAEIREEDRAARKRMTAKSA